MELLQLNYGTMQSTDGRIWARSYDPLTGMWLTPDPAGQFSNPFGFGGDPVNGVDRDGRYLDPAVRNEILKRQVLYNNWAKHPLEYLLDYADALGY